MVEEGYDIDNIILAGVVFLVFMCVAIITYFVLSPVVDSFFDSYNVMQVGEATDEIAYHGPILQNACKIIFALGLAFPVAWFVFWVFSREPGLYRRRLL